MKKNLLFILCLFVIQPAISQELITNFSYKDDDRSSSPRDIVEFNNQIFFTATTSSFGREIWSSNGDSNNASLLKDINPGVNSGVSFYFKDASVVLNDKLYFMGYDGSSSGEIWCTDGTTEGTVKVTDFLNKYVKKFTLVGDKIYFLVKEDDMLQVWVSDGTKAGTKLVKGEIPVWNTISFQGNSNDTFIFTFQAYGENDSEVWRSDGTLNGTFRIIDNIDGNGAGPGGSSSLTQYIEFNNSLYFISRHYLHKTDGTLENTQIVTSFHNANTRLINYADAIEVNGKLYFSFYEMDYNRLFIWETDGTEAGSSKIYDVTGDRYYMISNLERNGNNLVFCGKNVSGGTSPVQLNLANHSITYLDEIESDREAPFYFYGTSDACKMTAVGDNKYFISSPAGNGKWKAWIADYDERTSTNIVSLNEVSDVYAFGDLFYFSKTGVDQGRELWKSDGTDENTVLCDNINKSKYGFRNTNILKLNSNLIFNANDASNREELWVYKTDNPISLTDIQPGGLSFYLDEYISNNNEIYFVADDGISGRELWHSDGTKEGMKLLSDINEGDRSSNPKHLTIYKTDLFFVATKGNHQHLCKTDGSTVEFIKDFGENSYGVAFSVKEMICSGDYLYFLSEGNDLWQSDGTTSGTIKIKDLYACNQLTDVNGKLFFTAYEAYKGESELWSSDGTEAGTLLVKDIGIGSASQPNELYAFNNTLYFSAYTEANGREVWKSDGTEAGTTQLSGINSGAKSSINNANFCMLGSHLFFKADDGTNGFELWKTDGTESGTVLAKDINPGMGSSHPAHMVAIQDLLYFQAYTSDEGLELWKYDPSMNEAELVVDLHPGMESSNPKDILGIEDDIFFIAESSNMGRQLWKMAYNELGCIPDAKATPVVASLPNLTGECSVEVDTAPTATDNCGNILTGISTDPQSYSEQGTYTLTWTYEDRMGNTISQQQTVIVDDVTIPILNLKDGVDNITINLDNDQTQYTVVGDEFDPLEATDNCGVASVINDFNNLSTLEGATLPGGRTEITWTVTDVAGNIETISFVVNVNMTVGIDDIEENEILLYPNPTTNYVNLRVGDFGNSSYSYQLYSIKGKLIESKSIDKSVTSISMKHLVPSAYFIKLVKDQKELKTFKLIKN